jgi:D-alanyl-D-alanine carboxypeptidase
MSAKHVHLSSRCVLALSLFVCLVVAACSGNAPSTSSSTPSPSEPAFATKLRPLLLAKMREQQTPGAIIFVDDPGKGSWTTTLGTSDLATNAPMNVNSYTRIGSITKTFTATAILQLVDEGKLRLDDPVSKYQPEVPNGANITVRELLNMTSGLFDYTEDLGFNQALDANPARLWQPKELVAISFKHPSYFAPGKGFHYANTNYILLGMIIEQLTGMSVEQVFQQHIFTPLGMNNTSFPKLSDTAIPNPHPRGYLFGTNVDSLNALLNAYAGRPQDAQIKVAPGSAPQDATDWSISLYWTAGEAISTLHDLRIWAKALATGQLVSAASHHEQITFTPQSNNGYGLGVDHSFGAFIGHNGAIPGFQSYMGYLPQKGAMIVVLVNSEVAPNMYLGDALTADSLAKIIQQELFA